MTTGSSQPVRPPLDTPSVSPVSPATNSSVPGMSNPTTSSRRPTSRSTSHAHNVPAMPSGTLNQNTQCHEIETSAPPSTGPRTRPMAATMTFVPMARPSSAGGNASVTRALALANSSAAPTPCMTRQRISSVPSEAKPAPSEVRVNSAKPAT